MVRFQPAEDAREREHWMNHPNILSLKLAIGAE